MSTDLQAVHSLLERLNNRLATILTPDELVVYRQGVQRLMQRDNNALLPAQQSAFDKVRADPEAQELLARLHAMFQP